MTPTLEDLTKTQVVLLTILVSFVTSIATGIITASLLSQAPASITQTIDRVIEHTVDTANPAAATSTIVREVTVVKEEDEITGAIASAMPSVVRISGPLQSGADGFYGLGAIVSKDGLVIGSSAGLVPDASYTATLQDGTALVLKVAGTDEANGLILWKLVPDAAHLTFAALPLASGDAKLGQGVIALEGSNANAAGVGRVTSLEHAAASGPVTSLMTDISAKGETSGSPLVDLSGELAGIKMPDAAAGDYLSLGPVRLLLAAVSASQ